MTAILDVFLGERQVGTINLLAGNSSIFAFDEAYAADPNRPTLSQFYLGVSGELRPETKTTRMKLSPWFSNLLPEGRLREYLAARGGIHPTHEFQLLGLLGEDLPARFGSFPIKTKRLLILRLSQKSNPMPMHRFAFPWQACS